MPGSYAPAGKLRNLRTERVLPRRESHRRCIARSGRGRPAGFRGCHVPRQEWESQSAWATGCPVYSGAGGGRRKRPRANPASPKEITISARRAASAWSRAVWTISPRRSNAAISRSSKACGFPDRSSKTPITSCSRGRGITSADTMPKARQISRLTRGSVARSWQCRIWRVRTHSPERPELDFEAGSELRRGGPGTGPADHLFALPQPNGGPRCTGNRLGSLGQQLQRCLEIELRHLGQRPAAILSGKAHSVEKGFAGWQRFTCFALPHTGFARTRQLLLVQDGGWVHLI